MTRVKNKHSVLKATKTERITRNGKIRISTSTWYLSNRDIKQGKDVQLDTQGFKVVAL